jgi:hypothetical protein
MKRFVYLFLIAYLSWMAPGLIQGLPKEGNKFSIGAGFSCRYTSALTYYLWHLINQDPPSKHWRSGSPLKVRYPVGFSGKLNYQVMPNFSLSLNSGFLRTDGSGNFVCQNEEYILKWQVPIVLISIEGKYTLSFFNSDRFKAHLFGGFDYYWSEISLRTEPFIDIEGMNMNASGNGYGHHLGIEAEYFLFSNLAFYWSNRYFGTAVIREVKRNGYTLKNSDFYVPEHDPHRNDNFTLDFSKYAVDLGLRCYF